MQRSRRCRSSQQYAAITPEAKTENDWMVRQFGKLGIQLEVRATDFNQFQDKTLTCVECGMEFSFNASDQQFYADRQFSEPRRCPACRAAKKAARGESTGGYSSGGGGGYGGGGYSDRPREMFSATCDSCGKEARVPFRPTGTKPVYCSDCFRR